MSQDTEKNDQNDLQSIVEKALDTARHVLRRYSGPVFLTADLKTVQAVNPVAESYRRNSEDDDYALHTDRLLAVAYMVGRENRTETAVIPIDSLGGKRIDYTVSPFGDDGAVIMIGRDVTLELNMRDALSESRGLFKDLVDVAADFAWETDELGAFRFISTHGILGYNSSELVGHKPEEFLDRGYKQPEMLPFHAKQTVRGEDVWMRHADGHACCLQIAAMPITDQLGNPAGVRGVGHEVTVERLHQAELKRIKMREGLVDYIVNAIRTEVTPDGMLETAAAALGHSCLSEACEVYFREKSGNMRRWASFGDIPEDAPSEEMLSQLIQTGDITQQSFRAGKAMGTVSRYRDAVNGAIILWRAPEDQAFDKEVMELIRAVEPQFGIALRQAMDQKELEILSRTDPLTGLLNRRAFLFELERCLTRADREKNMGTLIYLDLDNFKPVNDALGHDAGDRVLKALTEILHFNTREYDLVARIGGDEFALWFDQMGHDGAEVKGGQILEACQALRALSAGPESPLSVSIGVSVYMPDGKEDPDMLISRSDHAMYEAKKSGKNSLYMSTPDQRKFSVS